MMIEAILSTIENDEQRNEISEFYKTYKKRLYSIALSKLHNEFDAEDAVQNAFSQIADKPEKFFEISPNKRVAYVDVMVRNISMKMFNAKSKEQIEPLDYDLYIETVSLEDFLLGKISRDEIISFIRQLPTKQRNVLILCCLLGFSIDETAEQLNISVKAASQLLTVARKTVRKFIDERNNQQ